MLHNLIPQFVHDQCGRGITAGEFVAAAMFVDISGFTPLTETLGRRGDEGAEIMTAILDSIFVPAVDLVYRNHGFITVFAGDSFLAIFPALDSPGPGGRSIPGETGKLARERGLRTAIRIRSRVQRCEPMHRTLGVPTIMVRIGLAYGPVQWLILGEHKKFSFLFRGGAVEGCLAAEGRAGQDEIIATADFLTGFDREEIRTEPRNGGCHAVQSKRLRRVTSLRRAPRLSRPRREILARFQPEELLDYHQRGEFREVVSLFLSIGRVSETALLDRLVTLVIDLASHYGGYFKEIDLGDKGIVMVIFFGAPTAHEDDLDRSLDLVLSFSKAINGDETLRTTIPWRAGIAAGRSYTGLIGGKQRRQYAVLGETVNLAARMMTRAEWGKILVSEPVSRRQRFDFAPLGAIAYKGFDQPRSTFLLVGSKPYLQRNFAGRMVGREAEISHIVSQLNNLCRSGAHDRGGIMKIWGDAGIGKTRLVSEALNHSDDAILMLALQANGIVQQGFQPFIAFFTHFFEQTSAVSVDSARNRFDSIIHGLCDRLRASGAAMAAETVRELERTRSFLGAILGFHWEHSLYERLDGKLRYDNTITAVRVFFEAQALLKPLVILVEDIHWLDPDSRAVITALSRSCTRIPFLIITTGRFNDDGSEPPLPLAADCPQWSMVLAELNLDESRRLAESFIGLTMDDSFLQFISDKTQGNPFYTEQFCLYLKEVQAIECYEHSTGKRLARLAAPILKQGSIPRDINALIIARVDRLAAQIKESVHVAAILGQQFSAPVLQALLGFLDGELPGPAFDQLLSVGQTEMIWLALSELRYLFKHALLRDVLYAMQLQSRRRFLHGLAGEFIEKLYPEDPNYYPEIAHHFREAERTEQATVYWRKTADHARSNFRNAEAIAAYQQVLAYDPPIQERFDVLVAMIDLKILIGAWSDARRILDETIALAVQVADRQAESRFRGILGKLLYQQGNFQEALTLLLATLAMIGPEPDGRALKTKTLINSALGNVYYSMDRTEEAIAAARQALAFNQESGDRWGQASCLNNLGIMLDRVKDFEQSVDYIRQALAIRREIGSPWGVATCLINLGYLTQARGEFEQSLPYFEESLKLFEESGDRMAIAKVYNNIGHCHHYLEDKEKALDYNRKALVIQAEIGDGTGFLISTFNIGTAWKTLGDHHQAITYFRQAVADARQRGLRPWLCLYLYQLAETLLLAGEAAESSLVLAEIVPLATSLNDSEILFDASILGHRITALENPIQALASLKEMVTAFEGGDSISKTARLHYEIWKIARMSGDPAAEDHRLHGLRLYREVLKIERTVDNKDRLRELEGIARENYIK